MIANVTQQSSRQEHAQKVWAAYEATTDQTEVGTGEFFPLITPAFTEKLQELRGDIQKAKNHGLITKDGRCINLQAVLTAKNPERDLF